MIFAAIVSFLYGLPHILCLQENDWNFKDTIFISSFKSEDVGHYLAQIKEVAEGNVQLSNTFLAEYKNVAPSPWPKLPLFFLAGIGKLFRLEIQHVAVLMDFLLPPVIFMLASYFLYILTAHQRVSLLGAFFLVLTPHITRTPFFIATHVQQGTFSLWENVRILMKDSHCYNCFSRPVNPQLTYLFLLISLVFFAKCLVTLRYKYLVFSSLFGILVSYSYVYFSSFLYVFLGVVATAFLLLGESNYAKRAFGVLSITLIFSFPFWYATFRFSSQKLWQLALAFKETSLIVDTYIVFILIGAGLILAFARQRYFSTMTGAIAFALLVSGIICLNQHAITSIRVQPYHYYWYVIPQSTLLAAVLIVSEFLKKKYDSPAYRFCISTSDSMKKGLLGGGIIVGGCSALLHPSILKVILKPESVFIATPQFFEFFTFVHLGGIMVSLLFIAGAITLQVSHAHYSIRRGTLLFILISIALVADIGIFQYGWYNGYIKTYFGHFQQLAPALQWLKHSTEKESVVMTCQNTQTPTNNFDSIISIYTYNNVYVTYHAQYYTVPPLSEIRDRVYNILYIMGKRSQEDFEEYTQGTWMRSSYLSINFEEYQQKLQKDLYSELIKYQVDYLFYGPCEQEAFQGNPGKIYPFLHEVYSDSIVKIYRFL